MNHICHMFYINRKNYIDILKVSCNENKADEQVTNKNKAVKQMGNTNKASKAIKQVVDNINNTGELVDNSNRNYLLDVDKQINIGGDEQLVDVDKQLVDIDEQ
ncbi:35189_t:CDS:2 [Gigaspora margarita]|uniref:35189_t:CDS:1 n=1 Tax=Gigaspora margarita TaxID=4874 RepID=A0ABM8W544_GIGMA|nr:35189_t:CDS:2 [Gigaspora margarita]